MECLEWILDNGGSVQDRDNLGGTPVHDAAEQGQVAIRSFSSSHKLLNLTVNLMVSPLTG